MIEFNLEKAKEGKPVCTRDGKPARIICFDRINEVGTPIVALVSDYDNNEICYCYTKNGLYINGANNDKDLMMATSKHEGWINLYHGTCSFITTGNGVYATKEEALSNTTKNVVATIKIEWEE